jgi:hypothetical protein
VLLPCFAIQAVCCAAPVQATTVPELAKRLRVLVLTIAHIIGEAMDMVDDAKEHHKDLSTEWAADGIRFGKVTL